MTTQFDAERCQRRNSLAARRDGINAIPLRFLRAEAATPAAPAALRYAHGTLPDTPEEALARINAILPAGAPALTADQVYLHTVEAANTNFVGDRFMFLSDRTLRNFAQDATAGVAFMNSHRTGGLSHPAELPMGRTYAGRYEQTTAGQGRTLVAVYMLRGVAPNGAQGPTTDDLHAMIAGGTVFDASVSAFDGVELCDVCGNALATDDCSHAPGTRRDMTADQRAAQTARGVPRGVASYTLDDAHMGEVSAAYDGAVPGAGFAPRVSPLFNQIMPGAGLQKTLRLARAGHLTGAALVDARTAYAPLLGQGDLPMDEIRDAVRDGMRDALAALRPNSSRARAAAVPEDALTDLQPQALVSGVSTETLSAQQAQLAQDRAALAAERAALTREKFLAQATADTDRLFRAGQLYPFENQPGADGMPRVTALLAQALADDASAAPTFAGVGASRYQALLGGYTARDPALLLTERLPANALHLGANLTAPADPTAPPPATADRLAYLAALGRPAGPATNGRN